MDISKRNRADVPFFACAGFPADVPHGFSTRLGGVSTGRLESLNLAAIRGDEPQHVRENFRRFCAATGTDHQSLVKNHQVHGTLIRPVTEQDVMPTPESPGLFEADGLVTDVPGVCLTIFSADCIPVLLCDPKRRVIAAAHAGWRGTALGIAARAAEAMITRYHCRAEDILAAIGPGISPCCFETHRDVPDGLRAHMGAEAEFFITPLEGEEKFRVDIKGANWQWLLRSGLRKEHIAISPACTACDTHTFWSHRIQNEERGTMAAVIQLNEV